MAEGRAYPQKGIQQHTGRKAYLDDLRAGATLFVICGHVVALAASMLTPKSLPYVLLELFRFVFTTSNLVFLMISGALLLPVRTESAWVFYRKRLFKVVFPMVVYYILYVCAKEGFVWLLPDHWLPMFRRMLQGPPVEAPHFWLIYVILGLYVLTPFLRWIAGHIPDGVFAGVMGVIVVICGLDTYLPAFGVRSLFSMVVDSFAGVFLLGYFLADRCSRRAENLFLAGGIVSFLISFVLIVRTETYIDYIYQNAPTMMLAAAAVFLTVKRLASASEGAPRLIRLFGRYSYEVLLIHWGVMHVAVKQILRVDVLSGGIWGGCLVMIALTAVLSLAGAIVLDRLLIWPLQRAAGWVAARCAGWLRRVGGRCG